MSLLDGDLAVLFGAAFAGLFRNATLGKLTVTDDGSGGFTSVLIPYPVKLMVEAVSDRSRAASGLPEMAVTLSVLQAGLGATVDLDDQITVGGTNYRVIRVEADPAGAVWTAIAVPS